MGAIIIQADTKSNKLLSDLAKKLGGKVVTLNDEQYEDFASKLPFVKAVGNKSNPVASEIRSSIREVKAGKRKSIDKLFV